MRKISMIFAAAALLACFTATSCLTTSSSTSNSTASSKASSSSKTTIKMYDNCPQDTFALAAELALKASNSSYKGVTTLTISGTPSTDNAKTALTYYGYCTAIKEAISKGTGKTCTVSFNTAANGKGTTLDFSGESVILKTLLTMMVANNATVYAIYKY